MWACISNLSHNYVNLTKMKLIPLKKKNLLSIIFRKIEKNVFP